MHQRLEIHSITTSITFVRPRNVPKTAVFHSGILQREPKPNQIFNRFDI